MKKLGHFDTQMLPRSLVDIVGDGNGWGDLAKIRHNSPVETTNPFGS